MSLTTNPNDPCLKDGQNENNQGQNNCYLVLSQEERDKGFIRPFRESYIHMGRKYSDGIKMLDKPEKSEFNGNIYVAIANISIDGKVLGGTYITQKELEQYNRNGGYIGGCGVVTTMGYEIAATYARNPKFYNATFCVGCNKHLPLSEFLWSDSNDIVGS